MPAIAGRPGKMILLRPKSFRVGLVLLAVLLVAFEQPSGVFSAEVELGIFKGSAHGITGKMTAVNKRKIKITGFNYDSAGPASWFHAMKRGADSVYGDPADMFALIPHPDTKCERLKYDAATPVKDETVELILPDDITEYESIGIYCHLICSNFGSVKLDHNGKAYEDAPKEQTSVPACPPKTKDEIDKLVGGKYIKYSKGPCTKEKTMRRGFDWSEGGDGGDMGGGDMGGSITNVSGAGNAAACKGCMSGGVVINIFNQQN